MTSHDVVAVVRRVLGQRSVGHTGTLDPFATGLLVVLTGKATRLARFLDEMPKVYAGTVRFGQASDTDDATGILTPPRPATSDQRPDRDQVAAALQEFVGTTLQMPPAYSAKKIDGERAYQRAREGKEVVLTAVPVTVHSAELLRYEWPDAEVRVSVSAGTYIRSLARDLGVALGTVAHCAVLRREAIGEFRVADAQKLDELQGGVIDALTPLELVRHLPTHELDEAEALYVKHGRAYPGSLAEGTTALVRGNELVAIAEVQEGKVQPVVVLASEE